MAELRERVARALTEFEAANVRTCPLYDPGERCDYCTRRADAVLAAIDVERQINDARQEGRREAAEGIAFALRTTAQDREGEARQTYLVCAERAERIGAHGRIEWWLAKAAGGREDQAPVVGEERGEGQG